MVFTEFIAVYCESHVGNTPSSCTGGTRARVVLISSPLICNEVNETSQTFTGKQLKTRTALFIELQVLA
jgi:hypothetical protein